IFLQAEDSIRIRNVTGVQTCALPINKGRRDKRANKSGSNQLGVESVKMEDKQWEEVKNDEKNDKREGQSLLKVHNVTKQYVQKRSEERRVGKERIKGEEVVYENESEK